MRNLLVRRGKLVTEMFDPSEQVFYKALYRLFGKEFWWTEWYDLKNNRVHSYLISENKTVNENQVYEFKDLFKIGNRKLPHAVFNMSSATDCASLKSGECKIGTKCYALRDERLYKTPLIYRRRQEAFWYNMNAHDLAEKMKNIMDKHGVKVLRINESGDFRTIADVEKLNLIAMLLSYYSIKTYTYTSRHLDWSVIDTKHITIIGSSQCGLDGQFIGVKGADKYAANARKLGFNSMKCPGDCSKCNACLNMKTDPKLIYVEMH